MFHCFQVYFLGLQKIESSPPSCYSFSIRLAIVIIDAKGTTCGGGPGRLGSQLLLLRFLTNVYKYAGGEAYMHVSRPTSLVCVGRGTKQVE